MLDDDLLHFGGPWQVGKGADRDGDLESGDITASPDNPGLNLIRARAMDDDLVDQAPEQGLLGLVFQQRLIPELRGVAGR